METKTLSSKAIAALEQGSKIEAIKITRMEQNIGLKEAKEIVELFLEQNPLINERLQSSASGGLGLLIVFIVVTAVASYFFLKH